MAPRGKSDAIDGGYAARPHIDIGLAARLSELQAESEHPDLAAARGLDLAVQALGADGGALFTFDNEGLALRALDTGAEFRPGAPALSAGEGLAGAAAAKKKAIVSNNLSEESEHRVLAEIGEDRFASALAAPVFVGDAVAGAAVLYSAAPRRFSSLEADLLVFILHFVGAAIRSAERIEEVVGDYRRVAVINRIDRLLDATLSLDELLDSVSRVCAEHLSVRGCIVRIFPNGHDLPPVVSASGISVDAVEGFLAGLPPFRDDHSDASILFEADPPAPFRYVLRSPLAAEGRSIGTIDLFDRLSPFSPAPAPFDAGDPEFVAETAEHIAFAVEKALLLEEAKKLVRENELRLREVSLLFEITNTLRSSLDLEEMLYGVLTCVTIGQGLGFNRAFLFLVDEDKRALEGRMGVGPLRPADAKNYWDIVDPQAVSFSEAVREYVKFNMSIGFEVDRIVKRAVIPIESDSGILARTIVEKTAMRGESYEPPENSAEREFFKTVGLESFVAAPLNVKGRVVGAVLVDNLVTREPITEEDITFLTLFANQAASAIEIARAYKDLEISNKQLTDTRDMLVRIRTLATLGEFSAGIAHELRNPLVSIGGFARRLIRSLPPDSEAHESARIIATEVEGLEQILGQILEFVAGAQPVMKSVDVNEIIEHVLNLFREVIEKSRIEVVKELDERVRTVTADDVQLRQLFINLIKNAIEAMSAGGVLRVRTTLMEDQDSGVGFEIGDTGHGIDPEDMEKIFNPFFTRKEKGIGLGLSMCSRIVEGNHGGRIFIDSKRERGTSVLVWLPASTLPGGGEGEEE